MNLIQVKSVLNKTKRRDSWFLDDYTINPYSGCSFNCLYCYIRGSKYGEHMEERLAAKQNFLPVLDKQLSNRAKKRQQGVVVLASATEPYLQWESDLRLTRGALELLHKHRFPVHVITKSDMVPRDFDILKSIDEQALLPAELRVSGARGAFVTFSFSTLDDKLAHIFEPGATPPSIRLMTLKKAVDAGLHAGVSLMPLLPELSDSQEQIFNFFEAFRDVGAQYVLPAGLTLFGEGPHDSKTLTLRAIEKNFPDKLNTYKEVFAYGFQAGYAHRARLAKRIRIAKEKYRLNDAIISLT